MATPKNKLGRPYGWPGWVVPCDLLIDELRRHIDDLMPEDRHPREGQADLGWRTNLAARAADIAGTTEAAILRRLWTFENGESMIASANLAESLLLAVGVGMDRNTDLPTLPGCKSAAREMVECHADMHDPQMTEVEKLKLARSLLNFSIGFVYSEAGPIEAEEEAELEAVLA